MLMPKLINGRITKDVPSASEFKQTAAKLYDAGNLTLFLAGDMSEDIAGAIVRLDGSHCPLRCDS